MLDASMRLSYVFRDTTLFHEALLTMALARWA